jgi:SAM-dependent methyltransferase
MARQVWWPDVALLTIASALDRILGDAGERAWPRVMGRLHFHGRAPSVDRLLHGVGPGDAWRSALVTGWLAGDSARTAVTRPVQRGIAMHEARIRQQWEGAAPGWARWEATVAAWMEPATEAMLALADVDTGVRVLDLACGAGSQTLDAARRVGVQGSVVASDISDTMLDHVRRNARAAGLTNVTTLAGAAEDLGVAAESFDAVICRLGLMLFVEPARALVAVARALRPGGRVAVVVFTTPATNPFMAKPMQILVRHAGKTPPAPGQPGIFALGTPGVLERALAGSGFVGIEQRNLEVPLRMPSAAEALTMMQEAFGAYRAVVHDSPQAVQAAAWAEVAETLSTFETLTGFSALPRCWWPQAPNRRKAAQPMNPTIGAEHLLWTAFDAP